jgi:hypothetical protein
MDGLNMTLKGDYAKSLSLKGQYGKKISLPVGLNKNFTEDIPAETTKNKGEKYLDAGHINAIILTPPITTILNAKLQNKLLQSMINDENNAKITSYICRFQYRMKAVTNNKVHPALIKYSPSGAEFKKFFSSTIYWGMIELYQLPSSQ